MCFALLVENGCGVESKICTGPGDVHRSRELDRLAIVSALCMSQLLQTPFYALGDAHQYLRPFLGTQRTPMGEGFLGGLSCTVNIGFSAVWNERIDRPS